MNGEAKVARESRISSILSSVDELKTSVRGLTSRVDSLIGPDPPSDVGKDVEEPSTLKDLLDDIPSWLREIKSNIEHNTERLLENLQ